MSWKGELASRTNLVHSLFKRTRPLERTNLPFCSKYLWIFCCFLRIRLFLPFFLPSNWRRRSKPGTFSVVVSLAAPRGHQMSEGQFPQWSRAILMNLTTLPPPSGPFPANERRLKAAGHGVPVCTHQSSTGPLVCEVAQRPAWNKGFPAAMTDSLLRCPLYPWPCRGAISVS